MLLLLQLPQYPKLCKKQWNTHMLGEKTLAYTRAQQSIFFRRRWKKKQKRNLLTAVCAPIPRSIQKHFEFSLCVDLFSVFPLENHTISYNMQCTLYIVCCIVSASHRHMYILQAHRCMRTHSACSLSINRTVPISKHRRWISDSMLWSNCSLNWINRQI